MLLIDLQAECISVSGRHRMYCFQVVDGFLVHEYHTINKHFYLLYVDLLLETLSPIRLDDQVTSEIFPE